MRAMYPKAAGRPKVYLETTLFNLYVEKERGIDYEHTVELFDRISAGRYHAYTSAYVIEELEKAQPEKKDMMLDLFSKYDIDLLKHDIAADELADLYVLKGIIPEKYRTDGMHIAIATVNRLDMIVSMNFKHIVKRKTIYMTETVNTEKGYQTVRICSPAEAFEYEEIQNGRG